MLLRALMVDVDGVLIRREEGQSWDSTLLVDMGIHPDKLNSEFFAPHFKEVVLGRADLTERLGLVLTEIAPDVHAQELMDYWFSHDAQIDAALLLELRGARRSGLQLHLATVQEHHRARYLWETLTFCEDFDAMHYAADLGYAKPDPQFYKAIERRTGFLPEEMLLIDDRSVNVTAAVSAGWGGHLWTPQSKLSDVLRPSA